MPTFLHRIKNDPCRIDRVSCRVFFDCSNTRGCFCDILHLWNATYRWRFKERDDPEEGKSREDEPSEKKQARPGIVRKRTKEQIAKEIEDKKEQDAAMEQEFKNWQNTELEKVPKIGGGVIVKDSLIENAGKGLFANRRFSRNEVITYYPFRVLAKQEARDLPLQEQTHLLSLYKGHSVIDGKGEPVTGIGGGAFANDIEKGKTQQLLRDTGRSRTNAKFREFDYNGKMQVDIWTRVRFPSSRIMLLYALRDIEKGEEIYVDYEEDYWTKFS